MELRTKQQIDNIIRQSKCCYVKKSAQIHDVRSRGHSSEIERRNYNQMEKILIYIEALEYHYSTLTMVERSNIADKLIGLCGCVPDEVVDSTGIFTSEFTNEFL